MPAAPLTDLTRCAIHTATHKPWSLAECCDAYAKAGVGGISVWRDVVVPEQRGVGVDEAAKILKDSGLAVPAYVRGGFFPSTDPAKRQAAIDDNKRCLDEAAAIGAEQVVLVVGAEPGLDLDEARQHVANGIAGCADHAASVGVKLSIEPLHPMYAADKSCINTLAQAREIWEIFPAELVGVAIDVYHVWWDEHLEDEIQRAGAANRIFGFHVCDWRVNTRDLLTDRGLMGDGCIDIRRIRTSVERADFAGFNEVEVFSTEYWAMDQNEYLEKIVAAYHEHV